MSRRRRFTISALIVIAVVLLSWGGVNYWGIPHFISDLGRRAISPGAPPGPGQPPLQADGGVLEKAVPAVNGRQVVKRIPKEASSLDRSQALPPSPPLPEVPVRSDQKQRRQAFQLNKSVDHIVLKDEPFQVDGQKLTIGAILNHLDGKTGKAGQQASLSRIQEHDLAADSGNSPPRMQAQSPEKLDYYGVRVVRPGENLWNIDYAIIREYFARRHILLPAVADEPAPDGRSSGIGRLLKFIQGVVYIYNVQEHRLETNPNLIHPSAVVVFFKISDLFAALNQLQPSDLRMLHYVRDTLRLKGPGESKELLNQQVLRN